MSTEPEDEGVSYTVREPQRDPDVSLLGMRVELATTTDAALARLDRSRFDLVLSDIARGGRGDEGVRALPMLQKRSGRAPVVLYLGNLLPEAPSPAVALGITNDPGELLELVLDGVEEL